MKNSAAVLYSLFLALGSNSSKAEDNHPIDCVVNKIEIGSNEQTQIGHVSGSFIFTSVPTGAKINLVSPPALNNSLFLSVELQLFEDKNLNNFILLLSKDFPGKEVLAKTTGRLNLDRNDRLELLTSVEINQSNETISIKCNLY